MSTLNSRQRSLVDQLQAVTGSSLKQATRLLASSQWDLETAIGHFYDTGMVADRVAVDTSKLGALFDKYADKDSGHKMITGDGVFDFCDDLGIDATTDVAILVLAYHMDAKTMGQFTRDEWMKGMTALGLDSIDACKKALPGLRESLKDNHIFKKFFAFMYRLGCVKGQKTIGLDACCQLMEMLLPGRFVLLPQFIEFLKETKAHVSKDAWMMTLDFALTIKPDLSNYEDDSAWPLLLDEFVEWVQEKGSSKAKRAGKK